MKRKKIMYIHPNTLEKRESQCVIPIGMIGISNLIIRNGFEYWAIDIPLEEYIDSQYDVMNDIIQYNPSIVLIDLQWAIYSYSVIELARKIKKFDSKIKIILGGITASIYYLEILEKYNEVDFIIFGDGEEGIIKLLDKIEANEKDFETIPNLAYRMNGKVKENEKIYVCNSLEKQDYKNYDFLKNYDRLFEKQGVHKGIEFSNKLVWIPTARGCTYDCSYCGGNSRLFRKKFCRNGMILNSPDGIIDIIKGVQKKYNVSTFGITHGLEVFEEEQAYELLERIEKLEFKIGIFNYLFQLPTIKVLKKFIDVVDEAKSVIGLPITAGNEEIRWKNGKLFTNKQIYEILDALKGKQIKVEIYFISNLKFDNEQNTIDTEKMIKYLYDTYAQDINLEISYGLETVQPYSRKQVGSLLNNFESFYYRYSPKFNEDLLKGKNINYIDGIEKNNTELVRKLRKINKIIEENTKNQYDIVYVFPPSNKQRDFELSVGIAYIQAYIKQFGFSSIQLIPKERRISSITNEIINLKPKLLGISVYDTNYYYAKLIAEEVKNTDPSIKIVFGGPTATFSYNLIMKENVNVDYCIRGYGEKVTKELLEYLNFNRKSLKEIKGLVYRIENNTECNSMETMVDDLDQFPSPYLSDISFWPGRKIVFTSRGCVHNCIYCNCASMCEKKIRFHSVERVIEELKYIADKMPEEYVLIGDDAFTMNIERAKTICKRIIEEKINLKLFCETRVDRIDDELIFLMKQAGFVKVDFGLESAVPRILRNVKKIFFKESDNEYIAEKNFLNQMMINIKKFKNVGIEVMVNIITGLPGETLEDAMETIAFIKNLQIESYSHNYLRIYAGTEIFNELEKWGYKKSQDAFQLPYKVEYPIDVSKINVLSNCVNRNEIIKMKNTFRNVINNPTNLYNIQYLKNNQKIFENIEINEEIFIEIFDKAEMNEVASIIVEKKIPTNNIYYILKNKDEWIAFNNLDRQCFIKYKVIKDKNFVMDLKCFEILLIEEISKEIEEKFRELNINPYVNPNILIKGVDIKRDKCYMEELVIEFCKFFEEKSSRDILDKFIKEIDYDIENLEISRVNEYVHCNKITNEELKIIAKFIKYYKLGEII